MSTYSIIQFPKTELFSVARNFVSRDITFLTACIMRERLQADHCRENVLSWEMISSGG